MNYGFSDTSSATSTDKVTHTADTKENTGEQLTVKRKSGPQEPSKFVFCNTCNFPLGVAEFFALYVMSQIQSFIFPDVQRPGR
jgi:hypothetical protein